MPDGIVRTRFAYSHGVGVFDTIMCGVKQSGHGSNGRALVFASLSAVHSHQCSVARFRPSPFSQPPKLYSAPAATGIDESGTPYWLNCEIVLELALSASLICIARRPSNAAPAAIMFVCE